jgi:class 3 adenylate cyclase
VPSLPTGTVTFVFTDIEGSTKLLQLSGSRYPELLARHHELLRAEIARHDGVEFSTEGDAFFVVFRDAPAAIRFAVASQRALAAETWITGNPVRVRMGIHTGIGELLGDTYVGLDAHRAARGAATGHGGQIVISEATRQLAPPDPPAGSVTDPRGRLTSRSPRSSRCARVGPRMQPSFAARTSPRRDARS